MPWTRAGLRPRNIRRPHYNDSVDVARYRSAAAPSRCSRARCSAAMPAMCMGPPDHYHRIPSRPVAAAMIRASPRPPLPDIYACTYSSYSAATPGIWAPPSGTLPPSPGRPPSLRFLAWPLSYRGRATVWGARDLHVQIPFGHLYGCRPRAPAIFHRRAAPPRTAGSEDRHMRPYGLPDPTCLRNTLDALPD